MEEDPGLATELYSPPSLSEEEEDEDEPSSLSSLQFFDRDRHVAYLEMMYQMLPYHYQSQEINRLTLAFFGLQFALRSSVDKEEIASWVLSFHSRPKDEAELDNGKFHGFHGSRSTQFPPNANGVLTHNGSHLASTYCALAILKLTGYDLRNIDVKSILRSMRNLQQSDGK